jgi:hypothetical protein
MIVDDDVRELFSILCTVILSNQKWHLKKKKKIIITKNNKNERKFVKLNNIRIA